MQRCPTMGLIERWIQRASPSSTSLLSFADLRRPLRADLAVRTAPLRCHSCSRSATRCSAPPGKGVREEDRGRNRQRTGHDILPASPEQPPGSLLFAQALQASANSLLRLEHLVLQDIQGVCEHRSDCTRNHGLCGRAKRGSTLYVGRGRLGQPRFHKVLCSNGGHILRDGSRDAHARAEEPRAGTARPPQVLQHRDVRQAGGAREADLWVALQHDGRAYERLVGNLHIGREQHWWERCCGRSTPPLSPQPARALIGAEEDRSSRPRGASHKRPQAEDACNW
mmetsp:Transcript_67528/g.218218  ORF Transcript_67528/g.218218 Transcript_67528/m.218218 type:complete len:282 (-) Transcript_67528:172-1017(-)